MNHVFIALARNASSSSVDDMFESSSFTDQTYICKSEVSAIVDGLVKCDECYMQDCPA